MPLIVIGADTPIGTTIVDKTYTPGREVRAFVSSPEVAQRFRSLGVKVATGDVSDESHVAGACLSCFSAVLIGEAARDDRERGFAADESGVFAAWAGAVVASSVHRVIWVGVPDPPPLSIDEVATVSLDHPDVASEVARLDESRTLEDPPIS